MDRDEALDLYFECLNRAVKEDVGILTVVIEEWYAIMIKSEEPITLHKILELALSVDGYARFAERIDMEHDNNTADDLLRNFKLPKFGDDE